eukprot:4770591-Pyramimonas_sp.AAC.1
MLLEASPPAGEARRGVCPEQGTTTSERNQVERTPSACSTETGAFDSVTDSGAVQQAGTAVASAPRREGGGSVETSRNDARLFDCWVNRNSVFLSMLQNACVKTE